MSHSSIAFVVVLSLFVAFPAVAADRWRKLIVPKLKQLKKDQKIRAKLIQGGELVLATNRDRHLLGGYVTLPREQGSILDTTPYTNIHELLLKSDGYWIRDSVKSDKPSARDRSKLRPVKIASWWREHTQGTLLPGGRYDINDTADIIDRDDWRLTPKGIDQAVQAFHAQVP